MTLPSNDLSLRSKPPKPVAWALLVSVLLNLFLVGAFVGLVPHVKHRSFAPMALGTPHGEYLVDWMARYLNPQDSKALHEALDAHADELKQAHSHVHQAVNYLADAFEQDPPNAVTLQTALDQLAHARSEVNDVMGKILQAAYQKLSPEGRHRLADLTQNPM